MRAAELVSLQCIALFWASRVLGVVIPPNQPSTAVIVDPSLVSVSLEFFTLPGYMQIPATTNCLANLAELRGAQPAVRIGGTTQDRATYDPNLHLAVNYTIASPADAPATLTYGPSYFTLASQLAGNVTLGLNRRLNNQPATLAAAVQAKQTMRNLFAFELGNEPEFYASNSPIIPKGQAWNQDTDAVSEKAWFSTFSSSVGNMFQGAVYLSWSAGGLLTRVGSDGTKFLKSISRHSYPQSACGGASTNLPSLMGHAGIVSYTRQYKTEAAATHAAGLKYFLGETNSATCGGGGISPTFGAALWIVDYVLQAAINGVDRLYFHQGTIGNCAYCFWGESAVFAPYFGAAFVSEFLGKDGTGLAMLDDGKSALAIYAIYSLSSGLPQRIMIINTNYFDAGSSGNSQASRQSTMVTFTGLGAIDGSTVKRLSAPSATSLTNVTIGGSSPFSADCLRGSTAGGGSEIVESVPLQQDGSLVVSVQSSEAMIVFL